MRVKASKILLLLALGSSVPAAFAHAHKATAKASPPVHLKNAKTNTKPADKTTVKVRTFAATKTKAGTLRERKANAKADARHDAKAQPTPRGKAGRHPVPAQSRPSRIERSTEPIAEAPAPVALPQPEIHVTHNRKQHLAPAPAGEMPVSAMPRKATTDDFLTTPAEAADALVASVARASNDAGPEADTSEPAVPHGTKPVLHPAATVKSPPLLPISHPPVQKALVATEKLPEPPPVVMPALFTRHGKLIMPAALKGSHEILVHQNVMADADGLDRIQNDEDLERMRASKLLVAIAENDAIRVDDRLPANRRFSRPWTETFIAAIGKAHYARFHTALQVNSAVRTVEFQQRLMRTNGNAAPYEGETASPHLTGQAVDFAKKGLSLTEIAWLRGYLLPLVQEGKVDVEEEFQQACFHISVYKKYMPQTAPKRTITPHRSTAMALATAVQ